MRILGKSRDFIVKTMSSIVAFGNPLLDITVTINDAIILNKYNLEANGQKELPLNDIENLLKDIRSFKQTYSPGGLAQNTLRVVQWLFSRKIKTTIFGSIGKDERGRILRELLKLDGVETRYIEQEDYPTGFTVALIKGLDRSLVAYIGAAEIFPLDSLKTNQYLVACLKAADLVYIEGFFLTKRIETANFLLDYCKINRKTLAFNLSGRYLCEIETENVENFAINSNIIFGNKIEFLTMAKLLRTTLNDLLIQWASDKKVIVVTNEAQPVLLVYNGRIQEISVPEMDRTEIIDTTGTGDAFVGGFFTGLLLKRSMENCVELGCYAAQEILKRHGCTMPQHSPNVQL